MNTLTGNDSKQGEQPLDFDRERKVKEEEGDGSHNFTRLKASTVTIAVTAQRVSMPWHMGQKRDSLVSNPLLEDRDVMKFGTDKMDLTGYSFQRFLPTLQ